jgi:hypothetical protein
MWIGAREALTRLDLPYQIMVAVQAVSRFGSVVELFEALRSGAVDGEYLF